MDTVVYTQRKVIVAPDFENIEAHTGDFRRSNDLHEILFQAIAGDARSGSNKNDDTETILDIQGLQFGILDSDTIRAMSVVLVHSTSTLATPGGLGDPRMGISAHGPISTCETCLQSHPRLIKRPFILDAIIIARVILGGFTFHNQGLSSELFHGMVLSPSHLQPIIYIFVSGGLSSQLHPMSPPSIVALLY